MQSYVNQATTQKPKLFEGEKWLVLTGLLGFLLAAICGVWVLMNGGEVSPGGDISKAFSFDAALGAFILSTAAIAPLSGLKARSRALFRRVYIGLALYSYGAETIQNFRGVNPRFVDSDSFFDQTVGNVFTFVALFLVLFYLYLGVQFFRSRAYKLRPGMALGVRYAMIAVTVSFAAGIWISMNQGRFIGADGNIIWLHGLGFHALQAVPIVAWLVERSRAKASSLIHITGITYLLGLIAIGWQTLNGHALMEWSLLPIAASICFILSIAAGVAALRKVLLSGSRPNSGNRNSAARF
ncbi:hypothetical protein PghCCS26_08020 [Paenibacillus glycanilyticus]|uniref:DUF2306 domain-containing protein n=1 Tax=Paenibacillus glycanilyticus TaxID=126569 RepID=A0ABQ6NGF5_9BACL|nr:hypothetical protein [Paenibacillus glycanilyticus]GMK43675.1 hypothetical protein PghCCS26_08020 [Paenibacillus glycanilyticus]